MMTTLSHGRSMLNAMTQTFHQYPPRPKRSQKKRPDTGSLIALSLLFGYSCFPRLWILGFWIFGSELGDAFSSWLIPAAGFIFAPWTTLLYAWMWAINSDAVTGWEWAAVAIGALLDLWFLAILARLTR